MYTITKPYVYEKIIQKSRFIVELIPLDTIDAIKDTLLKLKTKYPGAAHYCYGYRFHGKEKASDDGEPTGTAGIPILTLLQKRDIDQLLVVVIRYFGGIKLGAGGLVRAYSSSVKEALDQCSLVPLQFGYQISFQVSYEQQGTIERILTHPYTKQFSEVVTYTTKVTKQEFYELKANQFLSIEILNECYFANAGILE